MADAIYEVEAPDGTRFKFSGPEGASESEIQAFAQQQFKALSGNKNQGAEDERINILISEFKKAKAAGNKEDADAVGRELARLGVDASTIDVSQPSQKPREVEVSSEDYIREKAKALGELIEDNPVQAAQLGASGLGAFAGAALNPALKGAVRYTQEASQRPAFARPGVAPASPTPAVAPAAGQSVMRQPIPSGGPDGGRLPTGQTGTMPYNYAKAAGLTDIEAARALDMTKQAGGVHDLTSQRREALNRIQSSFPSETYVENPRYSGIMTPGQGVGRGPRESISFKPAVPPSPDLPQGQPGGPSQLPPRQTISTVPKGMSPLANATETIKSVGRLGANMVGDLLRSKAMGALGGGMAVYEGLEALKQLRAGNQEEAALSGIGALGGITSMIPTIPTAIIGGGLSAIPSLYRAYKSATPEQVQRMQTNVDISGNPMP
jgi:hypothetical protein